MSRLRVLALASLVVSTSQALAQDRPTGAHDGSAAAPVEPGRGDAARGATFFKVCMACHGAGGEGNPTLGSPRIAGQEAWYLERQLQHFRAGVRGADPRDLFGAQMRQMVRTLPDAQAVRDVVAYVRTLPGGRPEPTVSGDAERGAVMFIQCGSCHGPEGRGAKLLNAPILRGMSDYYLERQLRHFRAGIRGHHRDDRFGLQMASISQILSSDGDIRDVVAYINTLR